MERLSCSSEQTRISELGSRLEAESCLLGASRSIICPLEVQLKSDNIRK